MIIKDHSQKVGIASRVRKSYVLDMLIEHAMPIKLVIDQQEGITDRQGSVPDHQTSKYTC